MEKISLNTYAKNTWCPGCGNFAILNSIRSVISSLKDENFPLHNLVILSGIGCHAKIVDYINVNSFYSIHGRAVPVAEGIKLSNPALKVIVFPGDGDGYGEGLGHLIFAAKRNIDITVIIHNNRVYGLTTGQYTPTSPLGYRGRSTPAGTSEYPINPMELMLSSGATFVARAYCNGIELMKSLFKQAILHKGFSFVDVLQVCVTFFNMYDQYNKNVYELKDNDPGNFDEAQKRAREWDYNLLAPISLGLFYKKEFPTFDDRFSVRRDKVQAERSEWIKEILRERI